MDITHGTVLPAENPVYRLSHVSKIYRKGGREIPAVRDLDLDIKPGEWLAVQGKTGHGKTTLLQLLGGLDRPTAGNVTLDGNDLGTMPEAKVAELRATMLGFAFQTFNLIPTLTAQENVEAALVPLRVTAPERRERAANALHEVALGERRRHLPSELSGGQQQRVALARAIVKQPRVLLADEPTGNLDERTRDEILELLETLWQMHGLTLIVVTHDAAAARLAQRTLFMNNGHTTSVEPTTRCVATGQEELAVQADRTDARLARLGDRGRRNDQGGLE